ncbi:MAG: hypothetical protein Q7T85_10305 [Nitrosomonas sp.]|nr:hypothetical protein [Nitrosomonas sp.]
MENITTIARLFKHGDRHFTIIHETNAMINLVTEYMEQIAKAAQETPLDVAQRNIVANVSNFSATHIFDIRLHKID